MGNAGFMSSAESPAALVVSVERPFLRMVLVATKPVCCFSVEGLVVRLRVSGLGFTVGFKV